MKRASFEVLLGPGGIVCIECGMGKSKKVKSHHKLQREGKKSQEFSKKKPSVQKAGSKEFESELESLKARLTGPKRRKKDSSPIILSRPTFRAPSLIRAEDEERAASERKKSELMVINSLFEEPDEQVANDFGVAAKTSSNNSVHGCRSSRFSVLDVDGEDTAVAASLPVLAKPILQVGRSNPGKTLYSDDDDDL